MRDVLNIGNKMNNNTENKYIGVVKRFGDTRTKQDYGFIYNTKFGDLFFHKQNCSENYLPNKSDCVVFNAVSAKGGPKAINVMHINNEKNIKFLLEIESMSFLFPLDLRGKEIYETLIRQSLRTKIKELLNAERTDEINSLLYDKFKNFFEEIMPLVKKDRSYLLRIINFAKDFLFEDEFKKFEDVIVQADINNEELLGLWFNGNIRKAPVDCISSYIEDYLINSGDSQEKYNNSEKNSCEEEYPF
ncbi:MAG: cold shock domain-containing protein [Endomicrobia bacterium]|nr:cold shock domain-containing protein [Endomicrobiia bacterium]MCL2506826.1 cold shock domain-containing protein [Endomicrobiia bacterium]